eukprot:1136803-Pelagomonas_calceolata.AAC.14
MCKRLCASTFVYPPHAPFLLSPTAIELAEASYAAAVTDYLRKKKSKLQHGSLLECVAKAPALAAAAQPLAVVAKEAGGTARNAYIQCVVRVASGAQERCEGPVEWTWGHWTKHTFGSHMSTLMHHHPYRSSPSAIPTFLGPLLPLPLPLRTTAPFGSNLCPSPAPLTMRIPPFPFFQPQLAGLLTLARLLLH